MTTATLDTPVANAPAKAAPLSSIPAAPPTAVPAAVEAVAAKVPDAATTTVNPPASPATLLGNIADQASAPKDQPPSDVTAKTEAAKTEAAKVEAYQLQAPEGSPLNADDVKAIQTFAVENGLTKAQGEKVLAREVAGRAAVKTAQEAEVSKVSDTWRAQAEKQFGAKLESTVADAKRALLAFASADERKAIATSPFANNPMFLSILARAGQALPVEDTAFTGSTPSRSDSDAAHTIYAKVANR